MEKLELANLIADAIKNDVKLLNSNNQNIPNVCIDPKTMNPIIPVFVDTENGTRKGFTITISQP
jgi:hypothetical protein